MGAADAEADERPVHRVFVSEFLIGRFPVTQDDYARFIRATGYPSPAVGDLPLVASGGRDVRFRELAAPYVWAAAPNRRRIAARIPSSSSGTTMRRRTARG